MGRVAGQEYASMPVLRDLPFVAVESGFPADLEHVQLGPQCPREDVDNLFLSYGSSSGPW